MKKFISILLIITVISVPLLLEAQAIDIREEHKEEFKTKEGIRTELTANQKIQRNILLASNSIISFTFATIISLFAAYNYIDIFASGVIDHFFIIMLLTYYTACLYPAAYFVPHIFYAKKYMYLYNLNTKGQK